MQGVHGTCVCLYVSARLESLCRDVRKFDSLGGSFYQIVFRERREDQDQGLVIDSDNRYIEAEPGGSCGRLVEASVQGV